MKKGTEVWALYKYIKAVQQKEHFVCKYTVDNMLGTEQAFLDCMAAILDELERPIVEVHHGEM